MLALGWVNIQGLDVDAVATNTVKSQKRRNGGSLHYILQGNNKNLCKIGCGSNRIRITAVDRRQT